jgi:hypothetical protein
LIKTIAVVSIYLCCIDKRSKRCIVDLLQVVGI